MTENVQSQQDSNPILGQALDRAVAFLDGCEATTNAFKKAAGRSLRKGVPDAINVVRKQQRLIREAREALDR